jgi:hypothetical protein
MIIAKTHDATAIANAMMSHVSCLMTPSGVVA